MGRKKGFLHLMETYLVVKVGRKKEFSKSLAMTLLMMEMKTMLVKMG